MFPKHNILLIGMLLFVEFACGANPPGPPIKLDQVQLDETKLRVHFIDIGPGLAMPYLPLPWSTVTVLARIPSPELVWCLHTDATMIQDSVQGHALQSLPRRLGKPDPVWGCVLVFGP